MAKTCQFFDLEEERNKWVLIVVAICFIFAFIVISICIKVQSNFKAVHEEWYKDRHQLRRHQDRNLNEDVVGNQDDVRSSVVLHGRQSRDTQTGSPMTTPMTGPVASAVAASMPMAPRTTRSRSRHGSSTSGSVHRVRTWSKGDQLGQGSFGKVYMALDHHSKQMFVVKQVQLITDYLGNNLFSEVIKSTQNEVRTLSKLSHPNIVRYLGCSSSKNHLNIFLEYMSGGSIRGMLDQFGPFELTLIKSYTSQILSGLSVLHSQQIIHRDIKGSNILVNPDGCLKLADFGVAKLLSFETQLPSSLHGTVHWMAPEVINQHRYDYKADIYSLGITILEMINGEPPNYTKEALAVMLMAKDNDSDGSGDGNVNKSKIRGLNIQIPDNLGKYGRPLVEQCLLRNPNLRPTAKELLQKHPFLHQMDDIEFDSDSESEQRGTTDSDEDDVNQGDGNNINVGDRVQGIGKAVRLRCINDVKQAVKERVEISNKMRNELIDRKKRRDLQRKENQDTDKEAV